MITITNALIKRIFYAICYLFCEKGCEIIDTHTPVIATYSKILQLVFLFIFGYRELYTSKSKLELSKKSFLAIFISLIEIFWRINVYNEQNYEALKNESAIAAIADAQNPSKANWTYLSVLSLAFFKRKEINSNIRNLLVIVGIFIRILSYSKAFRNTITNKSKNLKTNLIVLLFIEQVSFYISFDQSSIMIIFKAFLYEFYELLNLSRTIAKRNLKTAKFEKEKVDSTQKSEKQSRTFMILNVIAYILANLMMFFYEWTDAIDLNTHIMSAAIEIVLISGLNLYLCYSEGYSDDRNKFKNLNSD